MQVIGLTGGIASGKSTVARMLREEHGLAVVDADVAARTVVEPGSDGLDAIVEAFGAEVLDESGALDRAPMRRRIAADPRARARLESITHPRIRAEVARRLGRLAEEGRPVAVVEAALLVETGNYLQYGALWVVSCSPELQIERLMERDGMTEPEARRMLGAQLPLADKEAVADVVIRNEGSLEDLAARVAEVVAGLRICS